MVSLGVDPEVEIFDDNRVATPDTVGAKELEALVLWQARKFDEPKGLYTLGRYGVMSTFRDGQWSPIPSLPDFEGVLATGRQFIFDVKVCSQHTYALSGNTSKSFKHQYVHMQRRAAFNAICFLLIHYNTRKMKTKTDPASTFVLPITSRSELWQAYDRGEQKGITRLEAELYGININWHTNPRSNKVLPDIYSAITELANRRESDDR